MTQLNWETSKKNYQLEVQNGSVVITPRIVNGVQFFEPQIYDNTGAPLINYSIPFEEFEIAESFIIANLITLDQQGKSRAEFLSGIVSALKHAENLLADKPLAYRQRLQNMQRWVLNDGRLSYTEAIQGETEMTDQTSPFNWHDENNIYTIDTEYGKVAIIENASAGTNKLTFGKAIRHSIQIIDNSGVIFKDYYPPAIDFMEAEDRVRHILTELAEPLITETHWEYIEFILNICLARLHSDGDPMTRVRLSYLRGWLGESLP